MARASENEPARRAAITANLAETWRMVEIDPRQVSRLTGKPLRRCPWVNPLEGINPGGFRGGANEWRLKSYPWAWFDYGVALETLRDNAPNQRVAGRVEAIAFNATFAKPKGALALSFIRQARQAKLGATAWPPILTWQSLPYLAKPDGVLTFTKRAWVSPFAPDIANVAGELGDERAFLLAMIAYPADTACRLVYADWLEEQGRNQEAERFRRLLGFLADPRGFP